MLDVENLSPKRRAEYERRHNNIKRSETNRTAAWHRYLFASGMQAINTALEPDAHYEAQISNLLSPVSDQPPVIEKGIPISVSKMASDVMKHAAFLGNTDSCRFLHEDLGGKVSEEAYLQALDRKRLGTAGYLWAHLSAPQRAQAVVLACMEGCMPALNMFKYRQADFNQPYEWEEKQYWFAKPIQRKVYPLEGACAHGQTKVIHFLIENGATINACNGGSHIRAMVFAKKPVLDEETKQFLIQTMNKEGILSAGVTKESAER